MRRLVVYAAAPSGDSLDDYVRFAVGGLKAHAAALVVVTCGEISDTDRAMLADVADAVIAGPTTFGPHAYAEALAAYPGAGSDFDEIVLTGDSWFGPLESLSAVLDRMTDAPGDFWEMLDEPSGALPDAAYRGATRRAEPWAWLAVRRTAFGSRAWADFWSKAASTRGHSLSESDFTAAMRESALVGTAAFPAAEFGTARPSVYAPDLLLAAGVPFLQRLPFTLFPPFLQQHAVIGREVAEQLKATGYPIELLWQHLARTVAPKALNTVAGMLEVITGTADEPSGAAPRVAVVAHISDLDAAGGLLRRIAAVPAGYDLIITTSDGRKAQAILRLLARDDAPRAASVDVRVTPSRRGRDMADFFIGCRDILTDGEYDLVVKVHSRSARRKTLAMRRYFRRYQRENLLASEDHVKEIFGLFAREPGLGLVFPPMMHIGFATMGRGWREYKKYAVALHAELGIHVPMDGVSPLAPLGGMWIARPDALRTLSEQRWLYRDYGRPGRVRYHDLARLQERVVVAAAAELGYHSRTVLTPEHTAISYTALEYKSDQMFSTTQGYPIDAIDLIHRAGPTGRGGVVGLSRMYLRLNHRFLAKVALPILAAAEWSYRSARGLASRDRAIARRWQWEDEDR